MVEGQAKQATSKKEAELSVSFYHTTWHHIPQDTGSQVTTEPTPNIEGQWITLLLCIQEIPGSNLDP
jgi:hypothetical protein